MESKPPKFISIAAAKGVLWALCDDGSLWMTDDCPLSHVRDEHTCDPYADPVWYKVELPR